jgi:hypothetical protein
MDYLLQDAEAVQTLATLTWHSSLAMRAGVTLGTQSFLIDRPSFLTRRMELRQGTDKDGALIATFTHGWTVRGTLTFETGQRFEWKNANIWYSHWKWTTPDGGDLMKFTPATQVRRLPRSESRLEVYPPCADVPETDLLAVFGWYLMLVITMEGA